MDDDPTPGGGVRKAHDRYSTDPANLAHVGLAGLLDAMHTLLHGAAQVLRPGGIVAMTVRPWWRDGQLVERGFSSAPGEIRTPDLRFRSFILEVEKPVVTGFSVRLDELPEGHLGEFGTRLGTPNWRLGRPKLGRAQSDANSPLHHSANEHRAAPVRAERQQATVPKAT
jgi:hypothetical protein